MQKDLGERKDVLLVVALVPDDSDGGEVASFEASLLGQQRYFQCFDSNLASKVIALTYHSTEVNSRQEEREGNQGREDEETRMVLEKAVDVSLSQLTQFGEKPAQIARMAGSTLVASLCDSTLVACSTTKTEFYGSYRISSTCSDASLLLPFPASDISCSCDGSLLMATFGSSREAALIISLTTVRRFGEEGIRALQLTPIRKLSDSYVTAIPGTLQFSMLHPREMVFGWAGRSNSHGEKLGELEIAVGKIKMSRSEVVQQVEGSTKTLHVSSITAGQWNLSEDAVVLRGGERELLLYLKNHEKNGNWFQATVEQPVDVMQWHPSSLLVLVGCFSAGCAHLFDSSLQRLCTIPVGWPSRILQRAIHHQSTQWLHAFHVDDKTFLDAFSSDALVMRPRAESQPHAVSGKSNHILDMPLHPSDATLRSPTLVSFRGGQASLGRLASPEVAVLRGHERLIAAVFLSDGDVVPIPFPTCFRANWRGIVRFHLGASSFEPIPPHFDAAVGFVQSLRGRTQTYFDASRFLLGELSKAAQRPMSSFQRDMMHRRMREILSGLRSSLGLLEAQSQTYNKYKPLLDALERRYVSDRLRLGQTELASQFVFNCAQDAPADQHVTRLFDRVTSWATVFGQADTVAPLLRSAAQRLRSFQKDTLHANETVDAPEDSPPSTLSELESSQASSVNRSVALHSTSQDSEDSSSDGNEQSSSSEDEEVEGTLDKEVSTPNVSSIQSEMDDTSTVTSDGARFKPPEWELGAGGCVSMEEVGRSLEMLDQGLTKQLSREIEQLWKEWRKVQAARETESDMESVTSGESTETSATRGKQNTFLGDNGRFSNQDALRLGFWLECRGKIAQALDVYQFHGLVEQAQRLKQLQRVFDPESFTFLPNISLIDFRYHDQ